MKHRVHLIVVLSLLATLFMVVSSVGAAPADQLLVSAGSASKDGLVVSLGAAKSAYKAAEDVLLSVTITNPTNRTIRVLRWFTPAEGLEEPLFAVKVNGKAAAYTGAIYKRPAPASADYLSLKSGESLSYTVNLGQYYDLSVSGDYTVAFSVSAAQLIDAKSSVESLTSGEIAFKVVGSAKPRPTPTPTPPPGPSTTFKACTTTQQSQLGKARTDATAYSTAAKNYLNAGLQGSRYTTWFGAYSSSRYSTVTKHFVDIENAFTNAGITFDCSCKQNYYAYVYPTKPYVIYLCKVFWTAPATGTDSKAGTLIHEMSHFNVVASTDDYVYGQAGAKDLAITDPNKAVNNADNHEYFAENTPALP